MQVNEGILLKNSKWSGDSGYHKRHAVRSIKRAKRIACHMKCSSSFLDVGCNEGLVSEYLLRTGKAEKVTGIELSNAKISDWLVNSECFTFVQGSIEDIDLKEKYDYIFYGAVHHHIVRERGFDVAVKVFQKLAAACTDKMYFETGQLVEGGRWEWQRKMAEYFSNDEEHFWFLLQSIEPMLRGFKVVGRFYIHGVRRYLCEISINREKIEPALFDYSLSKAAEQEAFNRVVGSKNGGLYKVEKNDAFGPLFKKMEQESDLLFIKQRATLPHVDAVEYHIGKSMNFSWSVRPLGISSEGIVFPWVDGVMITKFGVCEKYSGKDLIAQVDAILSDVQGKELSLPPSLFVSGEPVSAFDVIDFNVNNFLIVDGAIRVVDFELFSGSNAARNYMNFAKVYFRLGASAKSLKFSLLGGVALLLESMSCGFKPFEVRVIRRTPSLLSWAVASLKGKLGRILIKIIPKLSEK